MTKRENKYRAIKRMIKLASQLTGCIEFPHFGATYPDARCHEGVLWDLDSYDADAGGCTNGGSDPCPVCQTKAYIQEMIDNGISIAHAQAHLKFIFQKYGRVKLNTNN